MNFSRKKRCNPISPINELDLIHSYDDIKNDIKNKFKFCVPVRVVGYSEKKDHSGRSMLLVQPIDDIAIDGPTGLLDSTEYDRSPFCVNSLDGIIGNSSIAIGTRGFVIGCDKDNDRNHPIYNGSTSSIERWNTHEYTYGFFISEYKIDREIKPGDIYGEFNHALEIKDFPILISRFGSSRVTWSHYEIDLFYQSNHNIKGLYDSYVSEIGSNNKESLLDIVIYVEYTYNEYYGSMTFAYFDFSYKICNHVDDGFYIKQHAQTGDYIHNGIKFNGPCMIFPIYTIDFSNYTGQDAHDGALNGLRIIKDYRSKCPKIIPYWSGFGIYDYLREHESSSP